MTTNDNTAAANADFEPKDIKQEIVSNEQPLIKKEKTDLQKRKIGALWVDTSAAGNKYLSGNLEWEGKKIRIIIFKNNSKKEEKHPDYEIFLSSKEVAKDIL